MKYLTLLFVFTIFVLIGCTKDKTNYEDLLGEGIVDQHTFKSAATIHTAGYTIYVETRNGKFYAGHNELRVRVKKGTIEQEVYAVTFVPTTKNHKQQLFSCPHQYNLTSPTAEASYFLGYSVFTQEKEWNIDISFRAEGKTHQANFVIVVEPQSNKNIGMTSFLGTDNNEYLIALTTPQKPKVGHNEIIAGIYKKIEKTKQGSSAIQYAYEGALRYRLRLDPRMPEPAMGNHSSPNNQDLTQADDGWYYGQVNYTMTGNWTLNFIMENQHGHIIRGTEVSTDFTPGVEGEKSDLHLDILF